MTLSIHINGIGISTRECISVRAKYAQVSSLGGRFCCGISQGHPDDCSMASLAWSPFTLVQACRLHSVEAPGLHLRARAAGRSRCNEQADESLPGSRLFKAGDLFGLMFQSSSNSFQEVPQAVQTCECICDLRLWIFTTARRSCSRFQGLIVNKILCCNYLHSTEIITLAVHAVGQERAKWVAAAARALRGSPA